jgi:CubicO group peptidase (beta-lactamase class C family)
MTRRLGAVLLSCIPTTAALASDIPVAAPAEVGLSAERLGRIDRAFQAAVDEGRIAGALVLIGRRGKVAHLRTFGYADIESRRRMSDDAIFRIASMTKTVTAVAALQLLEEGRFGLDDPVSRYIPAFGKARVLAADQSGADTAEPRTVDVERPMTIRDLFRHTSGIWAGGERYEKAGLRDWKGSLAGFVEKLAALPLGYQPGAQFRYGYSTDILGYLVEVVSGMPLDRVFAQRIFEPLDLRDIGFTVPQEKVRRLTSDYRYSDKEGLVCEDRAESSLFLRRAEGLSGGGGWSYSYPGLVTTARDWWRFVEMLRRYGQFEGRRILCRKTVELMCADHVGNIPSDLRPGIGYGLGVGVVRDAAANGHLASQGTIYWAGGPHNTYYFVDFREEMSGVLLMQNGPYGHDLMRRFLALAHQAIND